jgi:hypothetical protein
MSTFFRTFLFLLAAALATAQLEVRAAATRDVVETAGDIVYVTGGVGVEERDVLKKMEKQFNLKLVFTRKDGAFISDVAVDIKTPSGKTVLADQAQGPIFMAKLPPGTYVVEATFEGTTIKRKVSVGKGLKTETLSWPTG